MSFSLSKQTIGQASAIIGFFTVVSQGLALLRESLTANFLGTSADYDALLMALVVPTMVGTIVMMGLPSAGIPFLRHNLSGESEGKSRILNYFIVVNLTLSLVLGLLLFLAMPLAGHLLSAGLSPDRARTVVFWGRIFCAIIPLRTMEAVFQSILHARYHFVMPSLSAVAFNITMIGLLLALFPSLGPPAYAIAMLAALGIELLLVFLPAYQVCVAKGARESRPMAPVKDYLTSLGGIVLIEVFGLLVDPFDRYLAGVFLPAGIVSAIYYANIISSSPVRVIVISGGTAIFPSLAQFAADDDRAKLGALYHRALATCILLVVPVAVYALAFQRELVMVIFQRGRFDQVSASFTTQALTYYLAFLFFPSAFFIQSRVFYALRSCQFLLAVRAIAFALKCLIGIAFVRHNWAMAICGGTSMMFVVSFVILEWRLVTGEKLRYTASELRFLAVALLAACGACLMVAASRLILDGLSIDAALWRLAISALMLAATGIILVRLLGISRCGSAEVWAVFRKILRR